MLEVSIFDEIEKLKVCMALSFLLRQIVAKLYRKMISFFDLHTV